MAQYLSSHHGIAVIDNAFSPEALEELLAFCEESTIWHDDGPNDYVPTAEGEAPAASVRDPLCAPLSLAATAEECRCCWGCPAGLSPWLPGRLLARRLRQRLVVASTCRRCVY